MEFFNNLYFNIIDILVFGVILTSCIVATFRGFVKELFSIISWILSLIAAFGFYEQFKMKLLEHIAQEMIVDFLAFGFPFLTTLIITNIISSWLSPKFDMNGLLIFDKICGFVFGAFRGVLLIILFYLGFLYLIGNNKILPNTLLESYSFKYIDISSISLVNFLKKNDPLSDNETKKE
jgi:membrane protein required for colicin V production